MLSNYELQTNFSEIHKLFVDPTPEEIIKEDKWKYFIDKVEKIDNNITFSKKHITRALLRYNQLLDMFIEQKKVLLKTSEENRELKIKDDFLRTKGNIFDPFPLFKGHNIYFIQEAYVGAVKIGVSQSSIKRRLGTLQTAIPFPIRLVASIKSSQPYITEKILHDRFWSYRIRGEWYSMGIYLQEMIEDIRQKTASGVSEFSLVSSQIVSSNQFLAPQKSVLSESMKKEMENADGI